MESNPFYLLFFDTETNGDPKARVLTEIAWRVHRWSGAFDLSSEQKDPLLRVPAPIRSYSAVVSGAESLGQFAPKHLTLETIRKGEKPVDVLRKFLDDIYTIKVESNDRMLIIAHNLAFDTDVIMKAVRRTRKADWPLLFETAFDIHGFCSMQAARHFCGLKDKAGRPNKLPRNSEFYNCMFPWSRRFRFTDAEIAAGKSDPGPSACYPDESELHHAEFDTKVLAASFLEAVGRGHIKLPESVFATSRGKGKKTSEKKEEVPVRSSRPLPPPELPPNSSVVKKSVFGECIVCEELPRKGAFVPCGHLVCCMKCGKKLNLRKCPICQQKVSAFIEIHLS